VANELSKLLNEPAHAERARAVSRQLKQENGPARAADLIEQVLAPAPKNTEELAYASGD
jgi:UDP:flavonoid glycosyltransferase YjiC (YdhE family)